MCVTRNQEQEIKILLLVKSIFFDGRLNSFHKQCSGSRSKYVRMIFSRMMNADLKIARDLYSLGFLWYRPFNDVLYCWKGFAI
jgi:hypothetical protein